MRREDVLFYVLVTVTARRVALGTLVCPSSSAEFLDTFVQPFNDTRKITEEIISTIYVGAIRACITRCLFDDQCVSVSVAETTEPDGTYECIMSAMPGWVKDFDPPITPGYRTYADTVRCSSYRVNPCTNSGTCNELPANPTCACTYGWGGDRCEHIDYCVPDNDCVEIGCMTARCVTAPETMNYTCECNTGYRGVFCETDDLKCNRPNPCLNGGYCQNTTDHWACICPQNAWLGKYCEFRDCKSRLGPGTGGNPKNQIHLSGYDVTQIVVGIGSSDDFVAQLEIVHGDHTDGKLLGWNVPLNYCTLSTGEYITRVTSWNGKWGGYDVVGSLQFHTNTGRSCGPWGKQTGSPSTALGKKFRYLSGGIGAAIDYLEFHFEC